MAKIEKVIKGLECCTFILGKRKCNECPYQKDNGCYQLQDDFHALLKEQRAIPPGKENDGNPGMWASWWYVCGACGREIDYHDRFCRHCGQAVKWDD